MKSRTTSMTCSIIAAAILAMLPPGSPVRGGEPAPAPLTGDSFEQRKIAIILAEQCKMYRGFEFAAVELASRQAFASSAANRAAESAASAASKSSSDPSAADRASIASRAAHMAGLRDRAGALGCSGGLPYLQQGMIDAYTGMGGPLTIAWTYRGQSAVAPGFTALTNEERQIVAAFITTGRAEFGTNWAAMEARFGAEGQRQIQSYAGQDPSVAAAMLEGDQVKIFASIRMESTINNAGYTARGTIIADSSPYGTATLALRKPGAPSYILAAPPKAIGLAGDDKTSPRGYIAFALRSDGTGVIGLFGEEVSAKAATLTAGLKTKTKPQLNATAFSEHCPFEKCFAIPAERMQTYAKNDEWLVIYGSTLPTPAPPAFELYALQIKADVVRSAATAAAGD